MPQATDIVGSWFPTGYYGHFRSKSRNDFVCEYRQIAKPQPPDKFLNRATQPIRRHMFSTHDNRNSFMTDALYFEQGLGRRRNKERGYCFKPDFYTWMPLKEETERGRPQESTYQLDFVKRKAKTQLLVQRPTTSFDVQPSITQYRYAHGTSAPNRDQINASAARALDLTATNRQQGAMKPKVPCRDTVASCLSWYRGPGAPAATKTTDFSNNACLPRPPHTAPAAVTSAQPLAPHPPSQPPPPTAPVKVQ